MSSNKPPGNDTDPQVESLEFDADLRRAALLFERRQLGDAEVIYRKILEKDRSQPVALNMLGAIAFAAGAYEQAIDFVEMAIIEAPEYGSAYNTLGRIYLTVDRNDDAIEALAHSLRLNPNDANANYNMACSLTALDQFTEALSYAETAMSIRPEHLENLILMATILNRIDRCEEALEILSRPTLADSSNQLIFKNKGLAQALLGRYSQALESYETALSINPNDSATLTNLALLFRNLGQFDSCFDTLARVMEIDPEFTAAHICYGYACLSTGRIKEGLTALEWRWRDSSFADVPREYPAPQWDGIKDLAGQTILLWPEQGARNVIIWASLVDQMRERCGRCIVEVPAKLVSLFNRSLPGVEVRATQPDVDQPLQDFDTHLPMGSLFLHVGPELAGQSIAFLVPDPARVDYWRQRLAELGAGPYVGIVWKGRDVSLDQAPNITVIDEWRPLLEKQAVFINLQGGDSQRDLDQLQQENGIVVHAFDDLDCYDDPDEVAALSAALDLAVGVSTATTAITAAVGTETWLLSWRESPWNNILHAPRGPKVINFERTITDPWDAIFNDMANRLANYGIADGE